MAAMAAGSIPRDLWTALCRASHASAVVRRTYATLKGPDRSNVKYFVYVLLLRDAKVYVGATDNPLQRFSDHWAMGESASKWVKRHGPPVRVMELLQGCAAGDEKYKTLEYMSTHGWENVRGGPFCRQDMVSPPAALADFERCRADFEYVSAAQLREIAAEMEALRGEG